MNLVSRIISRHASNPVHGTILFFYFLWMASLIFRSVHGQDDLDVFLHAGRRLAARENIYAAPHFNQLRYYYSPLFASMISLLADMPLLAVKVFWFALNYALLLRCVWIIKEFTCWDFKGSNLLLLLLCLCSGKLVMHNFLANQLTIFVLWSLIESFRLHRHNKPVWAIILFCVGINFKIMSILVIPFYVLGRMRFKWLFAVASLALLLLPVAWLQWRYNLVLLEGWWSNINPGDRYHVVQVSEQGFLDLGSLISKYMHAGKVAGEPAINFVDLGYWPIFLLSNILRVLFLALACVICRRFKTNVMGIDPAFSGIAAFIALIPVLMPHQRDYSFLLMMPMLVILSIWMIHLKHTRFLGAYIILILTSGILVWSTIVGSGFVDIFYIYRLITIGMSGLLLLYLAVMHHLTRINILTSLKVV